MLAQSRVRDFKVERSRGVHRERASRRTISSLQRVNIMYEVEIRFIYVQGKGKKQSAEQMNLLSYSTKQL
jgi:hypothetical protein